MIRLFVSLYFVVFLFVVAYLMFGLAAKEFWIDDWLIYDNTNDFIGELYLVEELHKTLPEEQFQSTLANYPKKSNNPLSLLIFSELPEAVQQAALSSQDDVKVSDPSDSILHYKLTNSNLVVRLGPLETYGPLENLESNYPLFIFIVLAISVLIWMSMLYKKLRRLEQVAMRLGEGDLSVRVSEKGRHRIGRLNHSFNQMAGHLESLISSHKSLTNSVAHELRTPVARIRFQLDMMHETKIEAQRTEFMYGISKNINLLSDLVDELLSYARFDRDGFTLNIKPNSLHESLVRVVSDCHIDENVSLLYNDNWFNADSEYQMVPFDPKHLERAVGNLVINALKYGHSKIQLQVHRTKRECKIYVDDDGPGIPIDARTQIFEAFRRLDDSRARGTGGYGLGLAIVRQIARRHGGDAYVESSPLGGARFVFAWPLVSELA